MAVAVVAVDGASRCEGHVGHRSGCHIGCRESCSYAVHILIQAHRDDLRRRTAVETAEPPLNLVCQVIVKLGRFRSPKNWHFPTGFETRAATFERVVS